MKVCVEPDTLLRWANNQSAIDSLNSTPLGAYGVMDFVWGNGHCDLSSNPGHDCLHCT